MLKRLDIKYTLIAATVLSAVVAGAQWYHAGQLRHLLERQAIVQARLLASELAAGLERSAGQGLERALESMPGIRETRGEVVCVSLHGKGGELIESLGPPGGPDCPGGDIPDPETVSGSGRIAGHVVEAVVPVRGAGSAAGESGETAAAGPGGYLRLGMSTGWIDEEVSGSRTDFILLTSLLSLLGLGIFAVIIRRKITGPLEQMEKTVLAVSAGNYDQRVSLDLEDEVGRLGQSINKMVRMLRRSHGELFMKATFLQQAADISVALDLEGHLVYFNDATQRAFGYPPEEVFGRPAHAFIVPEDREKVREMIRVTRERGSFRGEASGIGKDGSLIPIEFSSALLRSVNGNPIAIIVAGRDISEKLKLEASLRSYAENLEKRVAERTEEIRKAYDKLKQTQMQLVQREKLASLGQMAAGIAHEINNPVGFLLSNLSTLSEYCRTFKMLMAEYADMEQGLRKGDGAQQEHVREALARIERIREEEDMPFIISDVDSLLADSLDGAGRVREIVQNLKSFARMEKSELQDFDLNQIIEETLRIVGSELKYKAEVKKNLGAMPSIRGYPGELNQVFINLLLNAVQAIEEKGTITIETWCDEQSAFARVRDTGEGIPPENLQKLFDPFFTTKPVGKGTGLGLSISYGIVEKHGGGIEVESEPGRGSSFTVRLPLAGAEA